ncbi:MAG: TRAP transporter large permease subunit [Chloroflexota bacterium]
MEWQLVLLMIFGGLIVLMATGMPIAFCFMLINIIGVFVFFGGAVGLNQLILSINTSLATFVLLPVALFVLMGEVMFLSGMGIDVVEIVDQWLGRLPGRLALLSVGAGTVMATLTGVSLASVSILGSLLVPEMEKRGYKKSMTMGPILGSGGLAVLIPPSGLAVVLGAIAEIPIGRLLIAIIVPGLLLAVLYAVYIIGRCSLQPSIAPSYKVPPIPTLKKVTSTARYILPIVFIIFMVIGLIFLGVATPEEAAATGTMGVLLVAFVERRLSWAILKKCVGGTLRVTGMIFLIIAGARTFSEIMSFSGATRGFSELATNLPVNPILIVVGMQIVILILGCFMEPVSIMMLTLPMFMPVIIALGFDKVWFGAIVMLNIELALITPPFGTSLFVMKGVASPGTTMGEVYSAAAPFIGIQLIALALLIVFPALPLWLPGLMD